MRARPRRWRRLAIRLAACAVIGAVVTVGVAWACQILVPPGSVASFGGPGGSWPRAVPSDWPSQTQLASPSRLFGKREQCAFQFRMSRESVGNVVYTYTLFVRQTGWPALAMEAQQHLADASIPARRPAQPLMARLLSGYPKPAWAKGPGVGRGENLPLFPLWPGFALDTAFYAAIALTLWSAPPVIRRRLRCTRGRCAACGYDLKGAPAATCPECGR